MVDLPPWALGLFLYALGVVVFGVALGRMYMNTPTLRSVASESRYMAAGMAMSWIGASAIWPVSLLIVGWMRLQSDLDRAEEQRKFAEIEADLESGELIDATLVDLAEPWPVEPLAIDCGSCGVTLEDPTASHQLSRFPLRVEGEPIKPVTYMLCDKCFTRLSEGLRALPEATAYGVIDCEFEGDDERGG